MTDSVVMGKGDSNLPDSSVRVVSEGYGAECAEADELASGEGIESSQLDEVMCCLRDGKVNGKDSDVLTVIMHGNNLDSLNAETLTDTKREDLLIDSSRDTDVGNEVLS